MQLTDKIKKILPDSIKLNIKKSLFFKKYGFFPSPYFSDISGYEIILDTIIDKKIYELKGDIVEIGAFVGGGTYKLSKLYEKLDINKKIYAIDVFNPQFDTVMCTQGKSMAELYNNRLNGKNQLDVYKEITKDCKNIITIIGDSAKINLPCNDISFAYIDGNHSPAYVKSDFYFIWSKLVSKGVVGFDDYGYDLPHVTNAIHQLLGEQSGNILKIWVKGLKNIFIQKK